MKNKFPLFFYHLGRKAIFNTQPQSAPPVTEKATLSDASSIVLGLFSSRDSCSPYSRKIKGRFMRGVAYGASLSNLVSIAPGDRRQLRERAQCLQGFSRGDSEQGAPYKGSGESSPADRANASLPPRSVDTELARRDVYF